MKRTMNHTVARRMSRALAGAAWAAFGFAGTAAFAQPATPAAASGPAAAPAAQSADAALIKRGEYLARAGCIACHTASGGKPFAGGLKFDTPIGGIYSTNITPDPKTVGGWTVEDFTRAVREGVRKNGDTMYPAMPFPSYARLTDDDMKALYAYFMHGVAPSSTRTARSTSCGRCRCAGRSGSGARCSRRRRSRSTRRHTPIRWSRAVRISCRPLRRVPYAARADHAGARADRRGRRTSWPARRSTAGADEPARRTAHGLGTWTETEIVQFLKTGRTLRTAAFGGMTDVVGPASAPDRRRPERDRALPEDAAAARAGRAAARVRRGCREGAADRRREQAGRGRLSRQLHGVPPQRRPRLRACSRRSPATRSQGDDPTSLIHVVLEGSALQGTRTAPSTFTMPPFGWRLSDQEVADVSNFVRTSWGNTGLP